MIARNMWQHVGRSTINASMLMSQLQVSLSQDDENGQEEDVQDDDVDAYEPGLNGP